MRYCPRSVFWERPPTEACGVVYCSLCSVPRSLDANLVHSTSTENGIEFSLCPAVCDVSNKSGQSHFLTFICYPCRAKFISPAGADKQVSRLHRIIRSRGRSCCARNNNGKWKIAVVCNAQGSTNRRAMR